MTKKPSTSISGGSSLNGYCYLLKSLYGTQHIEMIWKTIAGSFSESRKLEYTLDRRALEMDADSFAATLGIDNIIVLYQERQNQRFYFALLESPFQIFQLWTFAVHNIFMLFELFCPSFYERTSFYLPNEAREILNLSSARRTIGAMIDNGDFKCSFSEKNKIVDHFYGGIAQAENFFNNTFGTNYDFIRNGINNSIFNDYACEVLEHWNKNLRHKLKKYSRAILYNPDSMD
ncbi:hypothetical protein LN736_13915 [Clostridium sp. WLY-B-L2]|uniref:Uncharacterized protein n=1 Tax=Clostridium aromativorans TaxID=2836848 RepID=A0ABS8N829_9CLOT|nr:hypothetical protein [Clostridium aromativorans]MCC9295958.1 hypothetical protein [Clostridium aromativorans]